MKTVKKQVINLAIFIIVTVIIGTSQISAQEPTETSEPGNESSTQFRRSGSPHLRVPAELMNAIPMLPPAPKSNIESSSDSSTETILHNSLTGQEIRLPVETKEDNTEIGEQSTPSYQGLLPEPPQGESVIGSDDRSRITSTTSFPWRTMVRLYIKFPNDPNTYICSGAIIDDFHVLTAGHCIHDQSIGGWGDVLRIVPGQDDDYMPYGDVQVTWQRTYTGWTDSQNPQHDWALLTLDRNIGAFTGWMGRQTGSTSSSIYPGTKNVAGYPADLGSGCCLYFDADTTHSVDEYRHWYWMDTAGGMSGGPVWRLSGSTRYILTVHAYGVGSKGVNSGTRLNQDKYDRIPTWINADTAPTDRADLIDDGQQFAGFSPTTITGGSSFSVYNDVRNVGTASSGSFYVSYYASTNQTITTFDYLIGEKLVSSISPFQYRDSNWSGTLPTNIPPGTYYIGWLIDSKSTVTEFDNSNNVGIKSSPKLTVLLAAPTNVSASDGFYTDKVRVTWGSVSGATSYNIYRATSATGSKFYVDNTTSTTYDDNSALPGVTYYYFVRSKASNGSFSSYSAYDTGYRAVIPPSNLQASDGIYTDKVRVTWNSVWGATSYNVYRATSATGSKFYVDNTTSTTYDDNSALPGTTYYYFVEAKAANSSLSGYSAYDTGYIKLMSPSNLQASDGTYTDKVQLTWNSVIGAVSYDIYRATSVDGNKSLLDNVVDTTYNDTSASSGITYYYFLKAKDAGDSSSDFSSQETGYRTLIPPTNIQASDGDYPDKVEIIWNNVPNAVSYEIYRAASESGNKTILGNSTSTGYNDTTAIADTTYYYFVKAKGANDSTSEFSTSDPGHLGPAGFPPMAPKNIQASNGTYPDKIIVNWDAVDETTSYTVYRADLPGGNSIELVTVTDTSYEDTTVTETVPYYYSVTAHNDFGTSEPSLEAVGQLMPQVQNNVYLPIVIK